jgi:hypothetical protein
VDRCQHGQHGFISNVLVDLDVVTNGSVCKVSEAVLDELAVAFVPQALGADRRVFQIEEQESAGLAVWQNSGLSEIAENPA